jgi:RNA-directed DNA polymerase
LKAYQCFLTHCATSGLRINAQKSPGICIFSDQSEEFRSIKDFKFLGYGMNRQGLFMHPAIETRLKKKLFNLINIYLLHYIEKPAQPVNIVRGGVDYDWDLMGLLAEIRNVLYGGLTEDHLKDFVTSGRKLPRMRGLMGFYALLDDHAALIRLDGWLVSTIKQAYLKRAHVFQAKGGTLQKISKEKLIRGNWYNAKKYNSAGFAPTANAPSFVRG